MKFLKGMVAVLTAIVLLLALSGCSDSGGSGLIDEETGTIYPDRWYSSDWYENDLPAGLEFYNCLVASADPYGSGNINARYYPVCRECHEAGTLGWALLSVTEPRSTTYYCGCGAHTPVMIRYNP